MGGVGGVGVHGDPAVVTDVVVILPGSVCLDLLATRWQVADLNDYMLKSPSRVPLPTLHLRRDASPSSDLSWLLVGSNFQGNPLVGGCNLEWDPNQHFDFNTSADIKRDAQRIHEALMTAKEVHEKTAQGTVLKLLLLLLAHTCAEDGKLPFGVVLGFMAIEGSRITKHVHETVTGRMEYVMPSANADGSCVLTGIVSTGPIS